MNDSDLKKFAESWIKLQYSQRASEAYEEHFWAYIALNKLCDSDPAKCLEVIDLVRSMDGSDVILSNLAAGPLEDLLTKHGASVIGHIEALAVADPQYKKLLSAIWQNDMPDSIWNRLQAITGPSW